MERSVPEPADPSPLYLYYVVRWPGLCLYQSQQILLLSLHLLAVPEEVRVCEGPAGMSELSLVVY